VPSSGTETKLNADAKLKFVLYPTTPKAFPYVNGEIVITIFTDQKRHGQTRNKPITGSSDPSRCNSGRMVIIIIIIIIYTFV